MNFTKLTRASMALLLGALMALPAVNLRAEEEAGGEELDFFLQEAEVVTASRRKQKVSESPVTIEVITAEQIKAYGAHNVWDALRFATGLDVREANTIDGNRATVSVRGFQDEFQASLQVLIDGRSVLSAVNGGVYWQQLPVQVDDIERIEIVRGPNSALFGSNAGLGVINIITRKAGDGWSVEANGFGARNELYRAKLAAEGYGVRLSAARGGQENLPLTEGSAGKSTLPMVPDPTTVNAPKTVHNNSIQFTQMNLNAEWDLGENTVLDLYAGVNHDDRHIPTTSINSTEDAYFVTHFESVKLMHSLSEGASLEAQLSRNDMLRNYSGTYIREMIYDLDVLGRFELLDGKAQNVAGASMRTVASDSPQIFGGGSHGPGQWVGNNLVRVFLSQSLQLLDPLVLAWAGSVERSETGGTEGAAQASLIYTPIENHIVRVMASRAPTIPSLLMTRAHMYAGAFGPFDSYVIGEDITPLYINNVELGLSGAYFGRRLSLDANAYYMELHSIPTYTVRDKTSVGNTGPPFFIPIFGGRFEYVVETGNRAIARGVEGKASYTLAPGRSLFVNYTQEIITDRDGDVNITNGTPVHKLNAGVIARLVAGFSVASQLGYKSAYRAYAPSRRAYLDIDDQLRVDARLAWANDTVEIFVGGQNLQEEKHQEFPDYTDVITQYYGGANIKFGGGSK